MISQLIFTVIIQIFLNSAEFTTEIPIEIPTEIPAASRSKVASKDVVRTKEGFCPEFGMTKILCELIGQEDSCDSDNKCEGNQLCCGDVCGLQCKEPREMSMPSKPNECPPENENEMCSLAPEDFHYCRDDYDCIGERKCCQMACGSDCLVPIWKSR